MNYDYKSAKKELIKGNYSVESYFQKNGYTLECAYCKFLNGNLEEAEIEFKKLSEFDFRANWAIKLIGIIKNKVFNIPSFLQVRNFLEIDLNLLILADKPDFIERIINCADFLFAINQESYKIIARAMYTNDFTDIAIFYLLKAKENYYRDPEMHLLLANCYLQKNCEDLALKATKDCLALLPEYIPAKKLFEKLSKN